MKEPKLVEIKHGWAAIGDDWAVHAPTKEEALQRYVEAHQRHAEIEARPLPPRDENDMRHNFE